MRAGGGWREWSWRSRRIAGHYGDVHGPGFGWCHRVRGAAGLERLRLATEDGIGPLSLLAPGCRSLADLLPGEEGQIVGLTCSGILARRLADLGFVPGATVRVVRWFAGGKVILVALRGWRLALRQAEARGVVVR